MECIRHILDLNGIGDMVINFEIVGASMTRTMIDSITRFIVNFFSDTLQDIYFTAIRPRELITIRITQ